MKYNVCPHWYRLAPDYGDQIMYEVTKRERCLICGKERVHAKVPEPHPTRDKQALVGRLQEPGYELIVDEWLPYGSKGPDAENARGDES